MATRRTTMRSKTGTKLYAVRDESGQFKDIQTYKRAHAADLRHKSKAEKEAAQGPIEKKVRTAAKAAVKSVKKSMHNAVAAVERAAKRAVKQVADPQPPVKRAAKKGAKKVAPKPPAKAVAKKTAKAPAKKRPGRPPGSPQQPRPSRRRRRANRRDRTRASATTSRRCPGSGRAILHRLPFGVAEEPMRLPGRNAPPDAIAERSTPIATDRHVLRGEIQRLDASRRGRAGARGRGRARRAGSVGRRSVEGGERLDLRRDAGVAVQLLRALPQPARARQGHPAQAGPPEHLSAHRRQLHAVLPGDAARSLGLVAVRDGLGACAARQPAGAAAEERCANPVSGDLRRDGLGGRWWPWCRCCRRWARPVSPGSRPAGCSTRPGSSSTRSTPGSAMRTVSGTCSCSPAVPPITLRSCTTFCERPARRSAGHQPIAGRQASISVGGCRPTGARAGGGASL